MTEHLQGQFAQGMLEHLLRCTAILYHRCRRWHGSQSMLDVLGEVFSDAGMKLDEEATCRRYGLVWTHKHAKRNGAGNLFRLHEIARQILGNFARYQRNSTAVWLAQACILDDIEYASPDGAAHIEFAMARGQIDHGLCHIAADVASTVRFHVDFLDRSLTRHLER